MRSTRTYFFVVALSIFFLSGCGEGTKSKDYNMTLQFANVTNAAKTIFQAFPTSLTARVVSGYDALGSEAWVVDPVQAAPTYFERPASQNASAQLLTFWHKGSSSGFKPWGVLGYGATAGTISADSIPLDRKSFFLAVEFMLEFKESVGGSSVSSLGHYVVAYGCVVPDPNIKITQSRMSELLANGMNVFAGRTCGQCPPADLAGLQDDPNFVVAQASDTNWYFKCIPNPTTSTSDAADTDNGRVCPSGEKAAPLWNCNDAIVNN